LGLTGVWVTMPANVMKLDVKPVYNAAAAAAAAEWVTALSRLLIEITALRLCSIEKSGMSRGTLNKRNRVYANAVCYVCALTTISVGDLQFLARMHRNGEVLELDRQGTEQWHRGCVLCLCINYDFSWRSTVLGTYAQKRWSSGAGQLRHRTVAPRLHAFVLLLN